jgi:class 3 adenylate cyclase
MQRQGANMQRRMAAIMVGDIVGYSAMMERAEERTIERLEGCRTLVAEKVELLDGRIFNVVGDATLAEFSSPINAVRCAAEIRSALAGAAPSDDDPLRMRFGIHLADVVGGGRTAVVNTTTRERGRPAGLRHRP